MRATKLTKDQCLHAELKPYSGLSAKSLQLMRARAVEALLLCRQPKWQVVHEATSVCGLKLRVYAALSY